MQRLEQLQQMREAADGQDGEQEKARVQHDALKRSVANASAGLVRTDASDCTRVSAVSASGALRSRSKASGAVACRQDGGALAGCIRCVPSIVVCTW